MNVPERPGLGVDLNLDVIAEHLRTPEIFEPAPEWDTSKLGFGLSAGQEWGLSEQPATSVGRSFPISG